MGGYEDLQVGLWIRHCGVEHVNIKAVNNGDFFCHDNEVDDTIVATANYSSLLCAK
jgi:hypothetical protein